MSRPIVDHGDHDCIEVGKGDEAFENDEDIFFEAAMLTAVDGARVGATAIEERNKISSFVDNVVANDAAAADATAEEDRGGEKEQEGEEVGNYRPLSAYNDGVCFSVEEGESSAAVEEKAANKLLSGADEASDSDKKTPSSPPCDCDNEQGSAVETVRGGSEVSGENDATRHCGLPVTSPDQVSSESASGDGVCFSSEDIGSSAVVEKISANKLLSEADDASDHTEKLRSTIPLNCESEQSLTTNIGGGGTEMGGGVSEAVWRDNTVRERVRTASSLAGYCTESTPPSSRLEKVSSSSPEAPPPRKTMRHSNDDDGSEEKKSSSSPPPVRLHPNSIAARALAALDDADEDGDAVIVRSPKDDGGGDDETKDDRGEAEEVGDWSEPSCDHWSGGADEHRASSEEATSAAEEGAAIPLRGETDDASGVTEKSYSLPPPVCDKKQVNATRNCGQVRRSSVIDVEYATTLSPWKRRTIATGKIKLGSVRAFRTVERQARPIIASASSVGELEKIQNCLRGLWGAAQERMRKEMIRKAFRERAASTNGQKREISDTETRDIETLMPSLDASGNSIHQLGESLENRTAREQEGTFDSHLWEMPPSSLFRKRRRIDSSSSPPGICPAETTAKPIIPPKPIGSSKNRNIFLQPGRPFSVHRIVIAELGKLGCNIACNVPNYGYSSLRHTFVLEVFRNSLSEFHGLQAGDVVCRPKSDGKHLVENFAWFQNLAQSRPLIFEVVRPMEFSSSIPIKERDSLHRFVIPEVGSIGADIQQENGRLVISSVAQGSIAEHHGLRGNDVICRSYLGAEGLERNFNLFVKFVDSTKRPIIFDVLRIGCVQMYTKGDQPDDKE